ncbi:MAG: T9SS type A sorting domain-containing protein, partial [Bacteroidia bacterium]|nr:T9SS type A sorting domain-containing protein [Bacteroidia bacterium]
CMNIWTQVFSGQLHRITRTVGMFTSWLDVSKRIATNLDPNLFDAVAPTYYFGISHESDSLLDNLGASATVPYLAQRVRLDRAAHEWVWIKQIVDSVAIPLNKKVYFYEGGQHITPIPFGVPSTYDQVLLDIQRDTAMYNLYVENYEYLKSIHSGPYPWLLMNFSLVAPLSAQYGSWGLLETLLQDTTAIPAPKLSATIKYIKECNNVQLQEIQEKQYSIFPNPTHNYIYVKLKNSSITSLPYEIRDLSGKTVVSGKLNNATETLDISQLKPGFYIFAVSNFASSFVKY